jgi:hypothetical protein
MNSHQARDRAEALFKNEGWREAHPPATEYEAGLDVMRLKTKRLRALRMPRDSTNRQGAAPNRGRHHRHP